MIFNRLFCNRGILIQNFRQHGWIGVLFLITLLFSLPLYIATEYRDVPQQITSLFQANGEVQILFAITLPVAAGIFLFRYIQSGAPSDLFHSLPLRRKHLLTINLLTGYAMILIPIWITTAIKLGMGGTGSTCVSVRWQYNLDVGLEHEYLLAVHVHANCGGRHVYWSICIAGTYRVRARLVTCSRVVHYVTSSPALFARICF